MEILDKLSKHHNLWLSMALKICGNEELSHDFVQDMYLRIDKYLHDPEKIIRKDGEINRYYIYVTIRNIAFKWFNKRNEYMRYTYQEYDSLDEYDYINNVAEQLLSDSIEDDIDMMDKEEAYKQMMDAMVEEVNKWHWYDQKLFRLYFLTDMTMRDIAEETRISLTSIYNSIKNYKEIMNEKFAEDVEDYFNKDYDYIIDNN